jgi:hypothetical protein
MTIDTPNITDLHTKPSLAEVVSKSANAEDIDTFLNDCTFQGKWADLKVSLRYPQVRGRLSSHIWNMQDQAMGEGKTGDLLSALPLRLDAATAKVALNYPFKSKAWGLTLKMLQLGSRFSDDQFAEACVKFSERHDSYYRLVIEWSVRHQMVSWQHVLGFSNLDDWQQLLQRADLDSNPSLYLVASGIMTAKQKRQAIQESASEKRILLIIKNMDLPKRWQEQVPEPFREAVLAYDLGI